VLQFAPSTYYASKTRRLSDRAACDARLTAVIVAVHKANFSVYGVAKMWRELHRQGWVVGRDQVGRLMKAAGLHGVCRSAKAKRTTVAAAVAARPGDLVDRRFSAVAPNSLWVADLTYVPTWTGFAYTSFITDVYSRAIVGWRTSSSLRTDLALDALEMAIATRTGDLDGLIHHSDRGVQYLSIRYTDRLADEGAVASVGSKGDSFDNALAEAVNGLYKAELIRARGPWRNVDDVELATARWVHWWNTARLHSACHDTPPLEYEAAYYRNNGQAA
jgi:putative transposase